MPKQILLADDSATIRKIVQITFANEDAVVTAVASGDEALARARASRPDIVLIDAGVDASGAPAVAAAAGFGAADHDRAAEAEAGDAGAARHADGDPDGEPQLARRAAAHHRHASGSAAVAEAAAGVARRAHLDRD